jgi:hypothetical protein
MGMDLRRQLSMHNAKHGCLDDYGIMPCNLTQDTPCRKCKDKYSSVELEDGLCFACRYKRHLTGHFPIDNR